MFLNRFQSWAISQGIWRILKGTSTPLPPLAGNASFESRLKYIDLQNHVEAKKGLAFTILQAITERKPFLIRAFLPNAANPEGEAYCWRLDCNCGPFQCWERTWLINTRINNVTMLSSDTGNKVNRFLQWCVGEFNSIYETALHQQPQITFSYNQKINNLIKVFPADFNRSTFVHVPRDGVTFSDFCDRVRLNLTDEVQIERLNPAVRSSSQQSSHQQNEMKTLVSLLDWMHLLKLSLLEL